ncbi:MAG: hypothetical protein Q8M40_11730 [Legionella sp.]|nr:hypothetical protein [Legionella sp.]
MSHLVALTVNYSHFFKTSIEPAVIAFKWAVILLTGQFYALLLSPLKLLCFNNQFIELALAHIEPFDQILYNVCTIVFLGCSMPDLISSKDKLNTLINNLEGIDLVVITIGGAHQSDRQQQCPNFCLEAAEHNQKVVIINLDYKFHISQKRLVPDNFHKNITCYYGHFIYEASNSLSIFKTDDSRIISTNNLSAMHHKLLENQHLKIVYLFQITPMIPEFYFRIANETQTHRVRLLGSYYKNSPGHIYSPVKLIGDEKSKPLDRFFNKFKVCNWYSEGVDGDIGRTYAEYMHDEEKKQNWLQLFERADLGLGGYAFLSLKTLSLETLFSPNVFGPENQQQRIQWRTQETQRFEILASEEKEEPVAESNTNIKKDTAPTRDEARCHPHEVATAVDNLIKLAIKKPSGFTSNCHDFDKLILKQWPAIREKAIRNNLFKPENETSVTENYQHGLWLKIKIELEKTSSSKVKEILTVLNERYVKGNLAIAYDAYKDERDFPGDLPAATINVLEFWLTLLEYASHAEKLNYPISSIEQIIEGVYDEDNMLVSHGGFIAKIFAETGMAAYFQSLATEDKDSLTTNQTSKNNNVPVKASSERKDIKIIEHIIHRLERNSRNCISFGSAQKATELRVALDKAMENGVEDVRNDEEIRRIISKHRTISFFRKTNSLKEVENSYQNDEFKP